MTFRVQKTIADELLQDFLIIALTFTMAIEEHYDLSGLTAKTVESIGAYQTAKTEQARLDAVESTTRLLRALENPADAVYKLFASV